MNQSINVERTDKILKVTLGENERLFYFSSPQAAGDAKEVLKILSWLADE